MTKRSPIAVFLLGLVTIGIYSWYWAVKTKTELNKRGGSIPTAWIWLIPIVGSLYWYWKYSEACDQVTRQRMSKIVAFVLLLLTGPIGQAVLQSTYNDTP